MKIDCRTLAKVPDLCPDTNLGSFEVVANGLPGRTVYVYWRQVNSCDVIISMRHLNSYDVIFLIGS
jgi:hypothetical protein